MPRMRDCYWAVHDADFKSPIGEMAQIAALIAREAQKLELHYGAQMIAASINLAPSNPKEARKTISGIQWRNL